jgi:hypothetical protein
MLSTRKIFVGSSREALEVAERVIEVIESQNEMNLTAVIWNTDAFRSEYSLRVSRGCASLDSRQPTNPDQQRNAYPNLIGSSAAVSHPCVG